MDQRATGSPWLDEAVAVSVVVVLAPDTYLFDTMDGCSGWPDFEER
jgi:hypothetical protein